MALSRREQRQRNRLARRLARELATEHIEANPECTAEEVNAAVNEELTSQGVSFDPSALLNIIKFIMRLLELLNKDDD